MASGPAGLGANAETIAQLYRQFVESPASLDAAWQGLFADLDQDAQLRFSAQFGIVGERSRPAERRPEGADFHPSIMLVSNIRENGRPIGSLPDGEMWFHHDMCYDKAPHKGTFLYAMELPSTGGNTLFSD